MKTEITHEMQSLIPESAGLHRRLIADVLDEQRWSRLPSPERDTCLRRVVCAFPQDSSLRQTQSVENFIRLEEQEMEELKSLFDLEAAIIGGDVTTVQEGMNSDSVEFQKIILEERSALCERVRALLMDYLGELKNRS